MSQRDGLGSAGHAPKLCASGTKGTIDITAVVQQWEVMLDGPEGIAFWLITAGIHMSPEGPDRYALEPVVEKKENKTKDSLPALWWKERCCLHLLL